MEATLTRIAGLALDSVSVYRYIDTVLLRVDASLPVPLWSQIEDGVRRLVAAGSFGPGAPVPSVRELAQKLRVNPATVAKAYQRLGEAGLLEVRRGDGTYVAAGPPVMAKAERGRALRADAARYASAALTLGAKPEEAVDELRAAWADLARRGKGDKR
jgi:GntR family transcriptional regulator